MTPLEQARAAVAERLRRDAARTLAAAQRWEDNPDVLVLTFRVLRGNIDQVQG